MLPDTPHSGHANKLQFLQMLAQLIDCRIQCLTVCYLDSRRADSDPRVGAALTLTGELLLPVLVRTPPFGADVNRDTPRGEVCAPREDSGDGAACAAATSL